jgi:hypothetical protein
MSAKSPSHKLTANPAPAELDERIGLDATVENEANQLNLSNSFAVDWLKKCPNLNARICL